MLLRCAAGHTFSAQAAALQPVWDWWGQCPICVIGGLCQAAAELHGNGCVDVSFCADGEHVRHVLLPRVCGLSERTSSRVPRACFEQHHSRPVTPHLFPAHDEYDETPAGRFCTGPGDVMRVQWQCGRAGHTWYTYERLISRYNLLARAAATRQLTSRDFCVIPARCQADNVLRACPDCLMAHQQSLFSQAKEAVSQRSTPPPSCAPSPTMAPHPPPRPPTASSSSSGPSAPSTRKRKLPAATYEAVAAAAQRVLGHGAEGDATSHVASQHAASQHAPPLPVPPLPVGSAESECARVLRCAPTATPLQVLGLQQAASSGSATWSDGLSAGTITLDDARRRFRQLAVRLHPDKCDLPGADEAFRRVSEAFNKVSGGAL